MGILDVEVDVFIDLVPRDYPRCFRQLVLPDHFLERLKPFDQQRLRFAKGVCVWKGGLAVKYLSGRAAALEEQDIGLEVGVGRKDIVGKPNDCIAVEIRQKVSANALRDAGR